MRKEHAQNIHVACNQSTLNGEKVKMADRKEEIVWLSGQEWHHVQGACAEYPRGLQSISSKLKES